MKNPFRFWMTGGAAMILAALSGRALAAEERPTLTRVSRFGIEETVSRLEASAQRHGLPVLARLRQAGRAEHLAPARLVIVLESSQGGTPVSMAAAYAQPALLLSVVVQQCASGAIEVLFSCQLDDLPEGLPEAVRHELEDLPSLVDDALAA